MVISVLASEERTIWWNGIGCFSFARYWVAQSGLISGDGPIRGQKCQGGEAAQQAELVPGFDGVRWGYRKE
jgi:hypothetical protein